MKELRRSGQGRGDPASSQLVRGGEFEHCNEPTSLRIATSSIKPLEGEGEVKK